MNLTLIVITFIMVVMIVRGYKRGMAKEIVRLISLLVTLFVISLIIMLYTSLRARETKNTIFTIIVLLMVAVIYSVVRIFLKSVKLLSKLPVIKIIDKLLGVFVGGMEGLLIVWLFYLLNEGGVFGPITERIIADTAASELLTKICEYNYLLKMISGF